MANQGPRVLLENLDVQATLVHQAQEVNLESWASQVQRVMREHLVKMEKKAVLDPKELRVFPVRVVKQDHRVPQEQQVPLVNEENQEQPVPLASRDYLDLLDPLVRMENLGKQVQRVKLELQGLQVVKEKMVYLVKEVCKALLELLVQEVLLVLRDQMVQRDLQAHLVHRVQWDQLVSKECLEKEEDMEVLGQKVKRVKAVAKVTMELQEKMA